MEAAFAAVVLAGGAGRRLGGRVKPAMAVAGVPMLHRVLAAVTGAAATVVVGPPELPVPGGAVRVQEQPPGAGPVAAAAAGLARVPASTPWVALLAADLPLLGPAAVATLRQRAAGSSSAGAYFVDGGGNPQWLCGVWRTEALSSVVSAADPGAALRRVLGPLPAVQVRAPAGAPPWYDCDTPAQLRQAEEWQRDAG